MAKTAAKSKQHESNSQMVWVVSRFAKRYEYRDDKGKKGSLQYTRAYVSASSDVESRHFMDQLEELKEKRNWRTLEGTLNELIRRAANDVYEFRGFLLHQHRPADINRIARWLKTDEKTCRQELEALQSVELIEFVPWAEITAENFPPPPEISAGAEKNQGKPGQTKRETKANSGKGKPERKKETGNQSKPVPEKDSKISQDGHIASGSSNQNRGETRDPTEKQPDRQLEGSSSIKQDEDKPVPVNPTLPEAMGDKDQVTGKSPPGSAYGDLAGIMDKVYEPQCREFGLEIFRSIFKRLPVTADNADAKHVAEDNSELGSFASAWAMAQNAKLKLSVLQVLWERSIQEATSLGNNRSRKPNMRNPRAIWWKVFKGLLRTAKTGDLRLKKGFG